MDDDKIRQIVGKEIEKTFSVTSLAALRGQYWVYCV